MIGVACDLSSEGNRFCRRCFYLYVNFRRIMFFSSLGPTKWTAHPDHQKRSHEENW